MEQHPEHERLQALCDDDDLDGVLELLTLDEIADAWWNNQRAAAWENDDVEDTGPDSWVFDFFWIDGAYDDSRIPMHRALVDKLVARADIDSVGAVAAGPMENLAYDDPDTLAWAEERARESAVFRAAIGGMWIFDDVSPETFARLELAAGKPLAQPAPSTPAWEAADRARDALEEQFGHDWYLRTFEDPPPEGLGEAFAEHWRLFEIALAESRDAVEPGE